MKLRILALFVIFVSAALLLYAAQQAPLPQSATQSPATAAPPWPGKEASNPGCACCDHAKHTDREPATDQQAETCCFCKDAVSMPCCHQDGKDAKAAMTCCNGKDAKASGTHDARSCCGHGASKACCGKDAMACNSQDKERLLRPSGELLRVGSRQINHLN